MLPTLDGLIPAPTRPPNFTVPAPVLFSIRYIYRVTGVRRAYVRAGQNGPANRGKMDPVRTFLVPIVNVIIEISVYEAKWTSQWFLELSTIFASSTLF